MMTENIQALVTYRLEQAEKKLKNAESFVDEVKKVLSKEM